MFWKDEPNRGRTIAHHFALTHEVVTSDTKSMGKGVKAKCVTTHDEEVAHAHDGVDVVVVVVVVDKIPRSSC